MFGSKNTRLLVLLATMSLYVLTGKAQTNIAFYPLEEQFNSYNLNPAFLNPEKRFTFSIFPMGGTSIGYNNQEVIRQLVSKFLSGRTTDSDYKDILNSFIDRSSFNQSFESSILSFTYRSVYGNFNFRIKENETLFASMNGPITDFITKSGLQQVKTGQVQNLPAQAIHYREYSLGYSLPNRNHRFTAGIRAKLYYGKAAFFSGLAGSINKEGSNYLLQTQGKVLISVPEIDQLNDDGTVSSIALFGGSNFTRYLTNNRNPGFGVDLGIKYQITPSLSYSMSLIDLGKINWNSNLNSKDILGKYLINGSDVTAKPNPDGSEIITRTFSATSISDSIMNLFKTKRDQTSFTSNLPVSVYSGLKLQMSPFLNLNLLDRYVIIKNMNYNTLSLLVDFDVSKKLSVSTGYAIIANSYSNFPLAVLFKGNFGQIYLGTDNLTAFILPSMSEFAGLTFGACFYLFRERNLTEAPLKYLPFYKHRKIKTRRNGLLLKEYPDY